MLEEFISIALEAFTNASGDVDKFELQLRRKLMSYNNVMTPQVAISQPVVPVPFEANLSVTANDPILQELEGLDINAMDDNEIIALAQKLGFMNSTAESNDE
jgi:hypothetical protein